MSTTIRNQQTYPFMMIPKRIWEMKLSEEALRLFMAIVDFAGSKGHAWPSNRTIAEKIWPELKRDSGIRKVQKGSAELVSKNMLQKYSRECQNSGVMTNLVVLKDCSEWSLDGPTGSDGNDPHFGADSDVSYPPPAEMTPSPLLDHPKSLYIDEKESLNKKISAQGRNALSPFPTDPKKSPKKPDDPKPSSLVFEAYSESFQKSYRDKTGEPLKPVRNARVNKICLRLVQQFGLDEAQMLVRFLLQSRDRRIVENQHALESLTDGQWQALRTQLHTGRGMTSSQARKIDSGAEMDDLLKRQMERIKAKYGEV